MWPTSRGSLLQELTASAHIRSPSHLDCLSANSGDGNARIFNHLEVLIYGTRIAHSGLSIRNSLRTIENKRCPGRKLHSVLNINSETVGQSGINIVADDGLASLYGRTDIDSSPAIRERLLAFLEASHPKIVSIDLSAVTHIDSAGVAMLIEALRVARAHRTELRLQGLHHRLLRLFEFTGVLSLFNGSTRG